MSPDRYSPALSSRPAEPAAALRACGALVVLLLWSGCGGSDLPKGITEGTAVAKMCHELNRGGVSVDLTLEIGDPNVKPTVKISARTGTCSPPVPMPCTPIAVGRVPLKLFEGDTLRSAREVILKDKGEYVFQPVITSTGQLVIGGRALVVGVCQALDFEPIDGGTRDGAIGEGGAGEAGATEGGTDTPPPADGGAPAEAGAADVPVATDAGAAADAAVDASAD